MRPIRQGDVLLIPVREVAGQTLPHLTLAEGEVTGHRHQICLGQAELVQHGDGTLYLKVLSETATLVHEEHHSIAIPRGNWLIRIQREYDPNHYDPEGRNWRDVSD
ncbi:MAG: hypothetical protein N2235_22345 [Fischerella sp.]|nr:hypothetical protein [Fischerella sp.]